MPATGKHVELDGINPTLYPFQRQLTQWALRKGRSALFADCGLGKTFMQLEWAHLTGEKTLIIAPLAVSQQTVEEGKKLGIDVQYVRSQEQITSRIVITNYEMIDHFDADAFGAVVLDESSILKSQDGKTRTKLIQMFQGCKFRLCCTATPAPNDIAEFANHAEFLGVTTRQEMLAMFFVNDANGHGERQGWRLKGHAINEFYRWMASWAMFVKLPSDIGFDDTGYNLPALNITPLWVEGDEQRIAQEQGMLFMTGLNGIQGRSAVRRATLDQKIEAASRILNDSDEQWIVWTGLNDEGRLLSKAVNDGVVVEGKDTIEHKVGSLTGFVNGDVRVLITKPSIAGFGLNLQNCHNQMFIGLSDSYESFYQATRRSWRFGQTEEVNIQIILSDAERDILNNVQSKEQTAEAVSRAMIGQISGFQQEELGMTHREATGYATDGVTHSEYKILLGDCAERITEIETDSIDFSVFSPPFLSLYVYSDSDRDMGNSKSESEFYQHFGYMLDELLRITKPGRIVACHVAQIPTQLIRDGYIGLSDFRGKTINAFNEHGFIHHGEIAVDKNPQVQAIRTKAKGLLFAQLRKDSSWLRPGLADFVLLFRKPGENQVMIHPDIDNETWITWAHPIWYDIRESDTLHAAEARTEKDERHIAPLQLGLIERCIRLWSNPDEMVFSPFMGIGSEGYEAIRLGRKFTGIELKREYFDAATRNMQKALGRRSQQSFDLIEEQRPEQEPMQCDVQSVD